MLNYRQVFDAINVVYNIDSVLMMEPSWVLTAHNKIEVGGLLVVRGDNMSVVVSNNDPKTEIDWHNCRLILNLHDGRVIDSEHEWVPATRLAIQESIWASASDRFVQVCDFKLKGVATDPANWETIVPVGLLPDRSIAYRGSKSAIEPIRYSPLLNIQMRAR